MDNQLACDKNQDKHNLAFSRNAINASLFASSFAEVRVEPQEGASGRTVVRAHAAAGTSRERMRVGRTRDRVSVAASASVALSVCARADMRRIVRAPHSTSQNFQVPSSKVRSGRAR
eukprot:2144312-Pleurochrysis_carterae.AAC.1